MFLTFRSWTKLLSFNAILHVKPPSQEVGFGSARGLSLQPIPAQYNLAQTEPNRTEPWLRFGRGCIWLIHPRPIQSRPNRTEPSRTQTATTLQPNRIGPNHNRTEPNHHRTATSPRSTHFQMERNPTEPWPLCVASFSKSSKLHRLQFENF